jgi:NDP-sugar pyrophosphorylase family protein
MTTTMKMVVLAAGRGSRLERATGGRSKLLLEVGGRTLLERLVELADRLGAAPLVVTRPEHAAGLLGAGVEILIEPSPVGLLGTLLHACGHVPGPFCWVTGDLLFSDPAPLVELVHDHLAAGAYASFFWRRSDRFKLKLLPGPAVTVTRTPVSSRSIPNFLVHAPAAFCDLAEEPRDDYLQRAIERGERVLCREYPAAVFEIDTPRDLATARRRIGELALSSPECPSRSSPPPPPTASSHRPAARAACR